MALSTFYAVVSATCFTLVGLWWSAVDRRRELLRDKETRRLVGGVYLTFLLPGVMGLFAQISPDERPGVWRTTFAVTAAVGAWSTFRLMYAAHAPIRGPLHQHRWVVGVVYLLVALVALVPAVAVAVGLTGLQGAALALSALVVMAHGLAWELLTNEPEPAR